MLSNLKAMLNEKIYRRSNLRTGGLCHEVVAMPLKHQRRKRACHILEQLPAYAIWFPGARTGLAWPGYAGACSCCICPGGAVAIVTMTCPGRLYTTELYNETVIDTGIYVYSKGKCLNIALSMTQNRSKYFTHPTLSQDVQSTTITL